MKNGSITIGRSRQVLNPVDTGGQMLGNPQRRCHMETPGGTQVAQRFEIHFRLL
jgi:hypothetical protein